MTKQTSGRFTVHTQSHTLTLSVMFRTFPVPGHHLSARTHMHTSTHTFNPDLIWGKKALNPQPCPCPSALKDKSAQIGANTSATMAL